MAFNLPVGMAVPVVEVPGGFFAVRDAEDTAFGDVLLAILTPVGTRPFNRGFGSRLQELLFAPVGSDAAAAKYVVEQAVAQWCPDITLVDSVVSVKGENVAIGVIFSMAGDSTLQTYAVTLNRSELLKMVYAP